jgi:hypothetical protein
LHIPDVVLAASLRSIGTVYASTSYSNPSCTCTAGPPHIYQNGFTVRFPAEYHRKRLFDEQPTALLYAGLFEGNSGAPNVSAPERAFLELLSEVGVRQPLQEACELAESTYNFRVNVLRELLSSCTSVKTVRLCLQFSRDLTLPWASKLASVHPR